MSYFTANTTLSSAQTTIQKLDLATGPHTFAYNKSAQVIYFYNGETAGDITVNLLGSLVTSFVSPQYGEIDVSAGLSITIPNGEIVALHTFKRASYLGDDGNTVDVTITGATAGKSFGWIV